MSFLQQRIDELIEQHGSLRAVARVLETDVSYLHRLSTGEKTDPGPRLLRRLGLRRVVSYERVEPPAPKGIPTGRAKGGYAAALNLTKNGRIERARKGAQARWSKAASLDGGQG